MLALLCSERGCFLGTGEQLVLCVRPCLGAFSRAWGGVGWGSGPRERPVLWGFGGQPHALSRPAQPGPSYAKAISVAVLVGLVDCPGWLLGLLAGGSQGFGEIHEGAPAAACLLLVARDQPALQDSRPRTGSRASGCPAAAP